MFIIKKIYAYLLDTIQTLLLAASVFLVIYIFIARPFQVSGQSMFPTFHDKEYVLTDLITIKLSQLKKGDVIVFKAPKDPDKDFIKRIIAIPGDTIFIKEGKMYVNNKAVSEKGYLPDSVKTYGGSFLSEGRQVIIGRNEYFVMGDNRPYSSDSREFGPITFSSVIGKSVFVYWPPKRMRLVENPF